MSTQIVNSNFDANVQEGQTAKYNLITKVCRRPFMSFALLAFFLIGKFPGNLLHFSAKVVQKKLRFGFNSESWRNIGFYKTQNPSLKMTAMKTKSRMQINTGMTKKDPPKLWDSKLIQTSKKHLHKKRYLRWMLVVLVVLVDWIGYSWSLGGVK